MQLDPNQIRLDGGTQPRAELLLEVIDDYAQQMQQGAEFPPVTVFFDGKEYWLADGFHRLHAFRKVSPDQLVEADVRQGSLAEAQWFSYGVNKAHGLRRTNADKERAVQAALRHALAQELSNVQIAEHCGVSEITIRRHRRAAEPTSTMSKSTHRPATSGDQEVSSNSRLEDSRRLDNGLSGSAVASHGQPLDESARDTAEAPRPRTGRDGRTINTANIGGKRKRRGPVEFSTARPLLRGHSERIPMIPLQLPPNNPDVAAATLMSRFSREFCESLIQELSRRLNEKGAA
jgi:transposase-like protein